MAKIEELFSELDKGIENLKQARAQLAVYRQALLKHAFEGNLTADWRDANAAKLEPADQLLAGIRNERENLYQQQLKSWNTAAEKWRSNGENGVRPKKPRAPKMYAPSLSRNPKPSVSSQRGGGGCDSANWSRRQLGTPLRAKSSRTGAFD